MTLLYHTKLITLLDIFVSEEFQDIINHPVHIIDDNNNLSPSAFIPFCEFGGNMSALGVKIEQFSVPVCNSFKALVLNNQLCYEVDLKKHFSKESLKAGLELGLILLVDYNIDRQINVIKNKNKDTTMASKFEVKYKPDIVDIFIEAIG